MTDTDFMIEALNEAIIAYEEGEIPVGAVVVRHSEIISRGRNNTSLNNDPTAHAEICAIRNACENLATEKLTDCELYTTLYPCPMCEMVIREVNLPKVVFGGNTYKWVREKKFANATFEPIGPILDEKCRGIFTQKLIDMGRDDIINYERA